MRRPVEQQMLAAIAAQPRITLIELCRRLDMTHRAVDEALLDLSRRRFANRLPGWVLMPDGHAALEPKPDTVAEELAHQHPAQPSRAAAVTGGPSARCPAVSG
jgi:hypothetical protein